MLQGLHERIRDVRQGPDGALYLLTDNADGAYLARGAGEVAPLTAARGKRKRRPRQSAQSRSPD